MKRKTNARLESITRQAKWSKDRIIQTLTRLGNFQDKLRRDRIPSSQAIQKKCAYYQIVIIKTLHKLQVLKSPFDEENPTTFAFELSKDEARTSTD